LWILGTDVIAVDRVVDPAMNNVANPDVDEPVDPATTVDKVTDVAMDELADHPWKARGSCCHHG
jgi:hypothetical protein